MNLKKIITVTSGLGLMASMALAIPAFAQDSVGVGVQLEHGVSAQIDANSSQTDQNGGWQGQGRSGMAPGHTGTSRTPGMMRPGVAGTVTAISGNNITITSHQGFSSTTASVTYTVDATNATVKKANATSTISAIAVGDNIFAEGTVTGTNVVATNIIDGLMNRGSRGTGNVDMMNKDTSGAHASTSPVIGNGQPVIAGTVSAINGTSLTISTVSNVTYTVDASNAKVLEGPNTVAFSSVVVGNKVLIQGVVNGTSVTASTVIDQSVTPSGVSNPHQGESRGFFGGIGDFFKHLFGF